MLKILRNCALFVAVLGCQACSTSGGGAASAIGPTGAPEGGSLSRGNMVPAVVGIPDDPGSATTYRIGPHDLLKIEVFQVEELSSEERVNDQGYITMPLIGEIQVGGRTPGEAEHAIEAVLGRSYLQDPQVNVFVSEYASQDVTVTGSVEKPGVYPLTGRTTLLQAIALAGGFDNVANEEEVVVFRQKSGGSMKAYVVDVEAIQEGTLADPVLVADDRVVVPKSGTDVFLQGAGKVLSGWAIRAPFF